VTEVGVMTFFLAVKKRMEVRVLCSWLFFYNF